MREVVDRLPVPAMDDDRDRMRALARRQAEVAELERLGAVCDAEVGLPRRGVGEDVGAVPHRHRRMSRSGG